MPEKQKYYLGLDCGTNSVGWAVTDEKYRLLRRKGKTLWGMRLFKEANTAADRRGCRANRRRLARRRQRITLLRQVLNYEIDAVDKEFFKRLDESAFWEEDKAVLSKNSLFYDKSVERLKNDSKFFAAYPTIWHLRKSIIESYEKQDGKKFDIREYYLAIEHIIKHRGHFLRQGDGFEIKDNVLELWNKFIEDCGRCHFEVSGGFADIRKVLSDKTTKPSDKRDALNKLKIVNVGEGSEVNSGELIKMLCGLKVDLDKCFALGLGKDKEAENDKKGDTIAFNKDNYEEKLLCIDRYTGNNTDVHDVIESAKEIYDFFLYEEIMQGKKYISYAMIERYNQHKKDLEKIELALKSYPEEYQAIFGVRHKENKKRSQIYYYDIAKGSINYASYIGNPVFDKDGNIIGDWAVSQEEINDALLKILEGKPSIDKDLIKRAKSQKLLPKQRGIAKGAIPYQAHGSELRIILKKMIEEYPSLSVKDESGFNAVEKIEKIHSFRIPFYVGPLKVGGDNSWGNELKETVTPWNFDEVVDMNEKATRYNEFIGKMLRECTYLRGEKVLPKEAPLYQKFLVLNMLNNLRIGDNRIEQDVKEKIYTEGFCKDKEDGGFSGGTISDLSKWARSCAIIDADLTGTNKQQLLPMMTTERFFGKNLKDAKNYDKNELARILTIGSEDSGMLEAKLKKDFEFSDHEVHVLINGHKFNDWGNLSEHLLNGIRIDYNGVSKTIIEMLEDTTESFATLLSGKYGFQKAIEKENAKNKETRSDEIEYADVDELYCSPAVKRSIWQAIKILKELKGIIGNYPEKLFLEVARRDEEKGKMKDSRRKKLIKAYEKYKKCTNSNEAKAILEDLKSDRLKDSDFRKKKLYLYYTQNCRCAYCNENIKDLASGECDIDHIYPRSKTKDDSIENNLVLVHKKCNKDKGDRYPIPMRPEMRVQKEIEWDSWHKYGLINDVKLERLKRRYELSDEELAGFISRQLVETGQTVKAIRDLINKFIPETKVILVKAGDVSELRQKYSEGKKEYGIEAMPEFVKVRAINDIHHAKDAYLNIVVGNVINGTFTDNPYEWIRRKAEKGERDKYSIKTELLLRGKEIYKNKDGEPRNWPFVENWDFEDSIKIMREAMGSDDVLWTRMPFCGSGKISKEPIKKDAGLMARKMNLSSTEKYGGFPNVTNGYFCLIENKSERLLLSLPIIVTNRFSDKKKTDEEIKKYVKKKFPEAIIVIPKIKTQSLLRLNGFPALLASKKNEEGGFQCDPAIQIHIPKEYNVVLRRIMRASEDPYYGEKDKITDEDLDKIFDWMCSKAGLYEEAKGLSKNMKDVVLAKEEFYSLPFEEKIKLIKEISKLFECNSSSSNLKKINGSGTAGKVKEYRNLMDLRSANLVLQSTTGFSERKINLKTVKPGRF